MLVAMTPEDRQQSPRSSGDAKRPGPRRSLTLEQIASAGVELADSEGVEAVTMRSLATRLGITAAGLYRYVRSRESLVALMVDAASAEVEHPVSRGRWLPELVEVAHEQRRVFAAHPWLFAATRAQADLGPAALDHLEKTIAILEPTGAGATEKFETIALVTTLAATFAEGEGGARRLGPLDEARYPKLLALTREKPSGAPESDLFSRAVASVAVGLLGAGGSFGSSLA